MFKNADDVVAGMDALLKKANSGKVKAEFWAEIKGVRNLTVKNYEDPNRGESARSGLALISGVLHIQPKGYIWTMDIPFKKRIQIDEHASSGTLVWNQPDRKDGVGNMLISSLMESYALENQVMKMLGKVEFVPYED